MKKIKVLIYTDSPVFGGHEVTLVSVIQALAEDSRFLVDVLFSSQNTAFVNELTKIISEEYLHPTDYVTRPGDVFRALLKTPVVKKISAQMRLFSPDVVLVSQGAIGLSACGLAAAKNLSVQVASFLPMAHPVELIRGGRSWSTIIQEYFYSFLYRLPDFFLTTSKSTREQLVTLHGISPERIFISCYGLDVTDKSDVMYCFKKRKETGRKIGIIGRVELYQKRHDDLIYLLAGGHLPENVILYIIGDGPDLEYCRELVSDLQVADRIYFVGWVDNTKEWYRQLDAIVLPSRFEGLPLVVLESMYYGVPIVASAVDGMREVMPESWLFPFGDQMAMAEQLRNVLYEDQSEQVLKNQHYVVNNLTVKKFCEEFLKNIVQVYKRGRVNKRLER